MRWISAWFWSRVRDNENWAQTLVRVLGNLFRISATVVAIGAAVIAASTSMQTREQQQVVDQSSLISVSAEMRPEEDASGCGPQFPLLVIVRNESSLTLMNMDILLTARERGRSTNTLEYAQQTISWDHIVPPQYELGMCYALGGRRQPNPAHIYAAQPVGYSVQLRRTEDYMLSETVAHRVTPTSP